MRGLEPVIRARVTNNETETDYIMPAPLQVADQFAALLPLHVEEPHAKITISKDFANKNYGNGSSVMVSLTLSCRQEQGALEDAAGLASATVDSIMAQLKAEISGG